MKFIATLGLVVAASVGTAGATMVTYSTNGSTFTCSGCTSVDNSATTVLGSVTYKTPTISFGTGANTGTLVYYGPEYLSANNVSVSVNASPATNTSYGFFDTSCGAVCNVAIPTFSFILKITETAPVSGTTSFTGSSNGGILTTNSDTAQISWVPAHPVTTSIDGTTYSVTSPTFLPSDATLLGQATIQGQITSAAPEPGSMLLLGAGLIGVGFAARKKFASRN